MRLIGRFLVNPRTIGSLAPSSSGLANTMLASVGIGSAVFEIGAGTGAITRYIPKSVPATLFEQDHFLAEHLRRTVTHGLVIEGFFHEEVGSLAEIPEDLVLVSSIPFRSLDQDLFISTVEALCRILAESPKRRLIQYTYLGRPPFKPHHDSLHWRRVSRVWANFPPATVWELRAKY